MHNKQFIISQNKVINDDFKCLELKKGFYLSYHYELNVVKANDAVLLGHAFQCDSSRDIPENEIKVMDNPIETYNSWNGRWVLLYKNEIHPDACAQIGIFYGKIGDELVVSSSLSLIVEMYGTKCEIIEHMPLEYNLLLSWIPGPYTVIKGINRLLPSQYITICEDMEVNFRNPISETDYSGLTINEIYKKIYELQKCAFGYIEKYDFKNFKYGNKKNVFNIGLTAGYDSRMQATMMKKMGLDLRAHTFERRKSTEEADNKYPKKIAKILDIEWDYIKIEKRKAKRVIDYNKHTFNSVKDRDWKWHYTCGQYDKVKGDVIVSNSIWEAFSNYYVQFGSKACTNDNAECKYEDLKCIFETLDGNMLAELSFKKYIEWVEQNPIKGLSWADRITFEQLMGIWDGNENQGKDLFSLDSFIFNPANSMEIFALVTALPKEKRDNRLWEAEMTNMICSELVSIPYNESGKREMKNYYFPFDKIVKGKKLILYGAGNVGRSFYMHLMTAGECEVVAWVDKNYKCISESGIIIETPNIIQKKQYDFIIIAVESMDLYRAILEELIKNKIDQNKILWEKTSNE